MSSVTSTAVRTHHARRRLSTPQSCRTVPFVTCSPLPLSLSALDLSFVSPTPTLASLRVIILSHLAELEARLSHSDLTLSETLRSKGEVTVEEARLWAKDALEKLRSIRDDVQSHLPEFHFDAAGIEELVRAHMNDFSTLDNVRSHLPEMSDVRAHFPDFDLSDIRLRLHDVRAHLPDMPIDINEPLKYLPTLSSHLQSLHTQLATLQMHSGCQLPSLPSTRTILDLLDKLLSSNLLSDTLYHPRDEPEGALERAAKEVARAVQRSLNGSRLVRYVDLPQEWRNNPFVSRGYRFIPLSRWPLLFLSLFALHNETLNIHTHMIPLLHSLLHTFPLLNRSSHTSDILERLFMGFAQLCLLCSVLWHTMSGCAHHGGMQLCAKVDYVGIGWLISATIATIVYYGFTCHPRAVTVYLSLCLLTGIVGSIFPFMKWFNDRRYKNWRVAFFLTLAFTGLAPLAHLAYLYSTFRMLSFFGPVVPSLLSYVIGLVFYVSHIPERYVSCHESLSAWTDLLGGGSHAIWHGFIVLAIYQHKWCMGELKKGVTGESCLL